MTERNARSAETAHELATMSASGLSHAGCAIMEQLPARRRSVKDAVANTAD